MGDDDSSRGQRSSGERGLTYRLRRLTISTYKPWRPSL